MEQGEKDPFIRQLRVIKKLISTISVTLHCIKRVHWQAINKCTFTAKRVGAW